jgi:hypothetical protein
VPIARANPKRELIKLKPREKERCMMSHLIFY